MMKPTPHSEWLPDLVSPSDVWVHHTAGYSEGSGTPTELVVVNPSQPSHTTMPETWWELRLRQTDYMTYGRRGGKAELQQWDNNWSWVFSGQDMWLHMLPLITPIERSLLT